MKMDPVRRNLWALAGIHGGLALALSLGVASLWTPHHGASFAVGSGLMMANFALLAWIWGRLIAKKSIAWTTVIIVIKYTVLLGAIFFLTQVAWFHVVSAGFGMVSFVLAALIYVATVKWE